jgi:cell wall-associated NlpC family hydrolase
MAEGQLRTVEFSQYVGRPYAQPFGCFELVRSVVIEQLGVEVPDYASAITEAQRTAAFLLLMDRHADRVDAPLEGDVILIGPPGAPYHCGIVVDPARCRMLHSIDQRGAHLDRYDGPRWRARVESFWRVR